MSEYLDGNKNFLKSSQLDYVERLENERSVMRGNGIGGRRVRG